MCLCGFPAHALITDLFPGPISTERFIGRPKTSNPITIGRLEPVLLVFLIILAVALAGMVLISRARGITEDISIAVIFVGLAAVSAVFLSIFLKNIKPASKS